MADRSKTVLIVEDEKDLLESYKELVETAGYVCMTALDGYEGLDMMSKNVGSIDLVI